METLFTCLHDHTLMKQERAGSWAASFGQPYLSGIQLGVIFFQCVPTMW